MGRTRSVFSCYDVKVKVAIEVEDRKQWGGAPKVWQTVRNERDLSSKRKGEKFVPRFDRAGRR